MFNIIPIEILFLILDSLDFISINSALRVTKVLYDRSRGFPRDILVRRCEAKKWSGCCRDIFQSGHHEYHLQINMNDDDYDYISSHRMTRVIKHYVSSHGAIYTDLEFGLYRFRLVRHLLHRGNSFFINILIREK
jgi:hypothetical protein